MVSSNVEVAGRGVGFQRGCRSGATVFRVRNHQVAGAVESGYQTRPGSVDVVDHGANRVVAGLGGVNRSRYRAGRLNRERAVGRSLEASGGAQIGVNLVVVGGPSGKDLRAVVGGVGANTVNLRCDRLELGIQRLALRTVVDGAVGRLSGQGDRTVEQAGDL